MHFWLRFSIVFAKFQIPLRADGAVNVVCLCWPHFCFCVATFIIHHLFIESFYLHIIIHNLERRLRSFLKVLAIFFWKVIRAQSRRAAAARYVSTKIFVWFSLFLFLFFQGSWGGIVFFVFSFFSGCLYFGVREFDLGFFPILKISS